MKTTRRLIFAAIPAFALAAIDVFADSYPDRRIAMVIPFPAGGPTDAIARPLAQALSASLGQPVIVENRVGGAGGTLGMRDVARAAPDGYTLTLGTVSTLAVAPPRFTRMRVSIRSRALSPSAPYLARARCWWRRPT
jgi:tripartite-type tricarboxylate transporter receptor subunit TctC